MASPQLCYKPGSSRTHSFVDATPPRQQQCSLCVFISRARSASSECRDYGFPSAENCRKLTAGTAHNRRNFRIINMHKGACHALTVEWELSARQQQQQKQGCQVDEEKREARAMVFSEGRQPAYLYIPPSPMGTGMNGLDFPSISYPWLKSTPSLGMELMYRGHVTFDVKHLRMEGRK